MRIRRMFELEAESYIEEQAILSKIPDAIFLKLGGKTKFFVPEELRDIVFQVKRDLLGREINEYDGLKSVFPKPPEGGEIIE